MMVLLLRLDLMLVVIDVNDHDLLIHDKNYPDRVRWPASRQEDKPGLSLWRSTGSSRGLQWVLGMDTSGDALLWDNRRILACTRSCSLGRFF